MKIIEHELYRQSIARIASALPVKSGTVLITGATGLIGSCIVDTLYCANQDYGCHFHIYALGRGKDILRQRFADMDSVICIDQDVLEPIKDIKADYIIHAASCADPRSYALYPVETILINVIGSRNVLELCKGNKTRILLTSTFEVYGKLDQDEYCEDDVGLIDYNQIRACYPESKRVAELLFRSYCEEYHANSVIARLPSVYGPTMKENDSKAHAQFIKNALRGEKIILKSKGDQRRIYCYVMDAVSGLFTALFKGTTGEAYNVANKDSVTTIAELAGMIADLAGTSVSYDAPDVIEQKGFGKPQNCILNTDKLEVLGWHGEYSLRQGLSETLKIMRDMG